MEKQQLEALVGNLLGEAKKQGATAAEADVSIVTGLSVTVRKGDVETVEHNKDRGLGVTVYVGQCKGSASTSDFSQQAIKETVAAACGIAKYTNDDAYAGLADAALMAHDYPELDLCHPWKVSAEDAIELGKSCEAAACAVDERITNTDGASVSSHQGVRVYGNSHGFVGSYDTSRHSVSCTVIAQEGEDMQRDYWYSVNRKHDQLEAVEQIGRLAAQRAVRRLGGRQVKTAKVPVLYSAEIASSLISHFISAIRGEALYRKTSFLVDSLGEKIFPEFITMSEQPHLKQGLGSAPFDGEGVKTQARDLVKAGVVEGYVLSAYSARRLNMTSTGNAGGVRNLSVSHSDKSFDALVKQMGTGLIVTELMGHGVNATTGDYSRGASGFWVENGEICYPVEEITVAGNLKDMYQGIVAIGSDIDQRKNVQTGSILINEMMVAGA